MGFFFRDRDGIGMEFFYHRVRTVGGGQTVIRFTRCTRHNKRKHARVFFFLQHRRGRCWRSVGGVLERTKKKKNKEISCE